MDTSESRTTTIAPLLAEITAHFSFIPPIFLALQKTPDLLAAFWQQFQTSYILNPLPHLFKEKLFLLLSYQCRTPYDLRLHCLTLHHLGIHEQELFSFLLTPLSTTTEIEHALETLSPLSPIPSWPAKDQQTELIIFTCATHLFLEAEHAEACRIALQRFLGIQYLYLSALLASIQLYHHWVANLYELLSIDDSSAIAQQFSSRFTENSGLTAHLHDHYAQCVLEQHNRDQLRKTQFQKQQQREQSLERSLQTLLALAEELVLGPAKAAKATTDEYEDAWTAGSILKRLLDLTQDILGFERIGLMTTHQDTDLLQPVALVGFSPQEERRWWHNVPHTNLLDQLHDPTLVTRIKHGEVLVLDTLHPPFQELAATYGTHSWIVAPMLLEEHLVGVLSLDYGAKDHTYTEEEVRGAAAIARLLALLLEREHLLQERAEAQAREIALTKANERINAFLGVAGHELKTPLTSIKGNIQLLQRRFQRTLEHERSPQLADIPAILQRADYQVDRLTRLVRDMIEVSRIRDKRLKIRLAPYDLKHILTTTIQQLQQQAPQRAIYLTVPDEPTYALFDVDYIEQVIHNYLSNALKFSHADKSVQVLLEILEIPAISQGQMQTQAETTQLRISVQDEGSGIATDEQELIWECFYQVENSHVLSGSAIGFGLGLFISRSIVEEHGGAVGVHSQPGKGSTFWFTLPRIFPERQ